MAVGSQWDHCGITVGSLCARVCARVCACARVMQAVVAHASSIFCCCHGFLRCKLPSPLCARCSYYLPVLPPIQALQAASVTLGAIFGVHCGILTASPLALQAAALTYLTYLLSNYLHTYVHTSLLSFRAYLLTYLLTYLLA